MTPNIFFLLLLLTIPFTPMMVSVLDWVSYNFIVAYPDRYPHYGSPFIWIASSGISLALSGGIMGMCFELYDYRKLKGTQKNQEVKGN